MPAQHRFYLPPRPRFLDTLLFDKKLSNSRLVVSVFTPLGEPSIYAAWWDQYLRHLAEPVFTPLGTDKALPPWGRGGMRAANNQRGDKTYCLADPVFTSLGKVLSY